MFLQRVNWPAEELPAPQVALLESLHGAGYVMPGGAAEIARLVRPIGLSAAQSLLLVGAGTGGPLLSLASEFGCRIEGFEAADAFLAGACTTLAPWSPSAPAFGAGTFDHALALMPLGRADPAPILAAFCTAIRPGGHLVLLDVIAGKPDERITEWLARDQRGIRPPDEATVTAILTQLGFNSCMVEDVTDRHLRLTTAAWQRYLQTLDRRPAPALASVLLAEAERALLGCELMQTGRLRLLRWHAIRDVARGIDPGSVKLEIMLSVQFKDWRKAMAQWEIMSQLPACEAESVALRQFIVEGIARDPKALPEEVQIFAGVLNPSVHMSRPPSARTRQTG